ncbi:hypothetical protein DQ04_00281170 [Trypanosoma grayi]|uniref:hypothetical protein n=1 Tax=Trypanosoma grayi TaxID=71804 RepID=UPI0004F40686|nr:hypothetical protein DQ04_00281170 [Trypanosoma grayi]KEG14854.1 hypothetical protein DQ04_00281170 [Trypanosoma grayi]
MFRYCVELLSCTWSGAQQESTPPVCLEVHCQKRGARCRVECLPAQMAVRSAPETERILLSVLRDGAVLARSDAIEIGGVSRRVGARTVPLMAGAAVLCSVRLMWSVEEEDGTVFSRHVEDYVGDRRQAAAPVEQEETVVTAVSAAAAATAITAPAGGFVSRQVGCSSPTASPLSLTLTPKAAAAAVAVKESTAFSEDLSAQAVIAQQYLDHQQQQHQQQQQQKEEQQNEQCTIVGTRGAGYRLSGREELGARWCVGTQRHLPHDGVPDYYVTSTQLEGRPMAWHNLYTSPAPLLVADGLMLEAVSCSTLVPPVSGCDSPQMSSQKGGSALEDIILRPTKAPETSGEEAQSLLYSNRKKVEWRRLTSSDASNAARPTLHTR